MSQYLDISVPITSDILVWSTHERPTLTASDNSYMGAVNRVTTITLTSHTGTHLDAPRHFIPSGSAIDTVPLDTLLGPVQVLDFTNLVQIDASALAAAALNDINRVLFKTGNSNWVRTGPVPDTPAHLTESAAHFLLERGVILVGIDGLTVDGPDSVGAHQALLQAGVVILETIDLSNVEAGRYELICLSLRIAGADGAPARAVLKSS